MSGNGTPKRDVRTTVGNGVPESFTCIESVSALFPVVAGNETSMRIRSQVLGPHAESKREAMEVVTATKVVAQCFQATKDNINTIYCALESAVAATEIDNIEYSGNNGTLQGKWALGGEATNEAVTQDTIISPNGSSTESMGLNLAAFDSWTFTKAATSWDLTETTIELDYYQTIDSASATVTISINDGSNTSVLTLPVSVVDEGAWKHLSLPASAFIGNADVSAITKVFFMVTKRRNLQTAYVDNLGFRAEPGSVNFELWHHGSSAPANDGTVIYTDGDKYTEIGDRGIGGKLVSTVTMALRGGKHIYHVREMIAGAGKEFVGNTLIVIDDFYSFVILRNDTDVTVFGPDTTQGKNYYEPGFAWKAEVADGLIDLIPGINGDGAFSDLMFSIMATQPTYVESMETRQYDSSGAMVDSSPDTLAVAVIEDKSMDFVARPANAHGVQKVHQYKLSERPVFLEDGGKIEVYYNAADDDPVTSSVLEVRYWYDPNA